MQHQSQNPSKGPTAGIAGLPAERLVISSREIEHYIAAGKQMQAEALAAMIKGGFRRLAGVFRRRPAAPRGTATPHRA